MIRISVTKNHVIVTHQTDRESNRKTMRAISLEYHDVVPREEVDSSGFPGEGPATYKLDPNEFGRHLLAIRRVTKRKLSTVFDLMRGIEDSIHLFLTFDDGGSSAHAYTADRIEGFGYHGHFLIPINYIGKPSFLTKGQIRNLRERGHVIGTHSSSHPRRISYCSWDELREEWSKSIRVLSDILGETVVVASIPGGYYSKKVVRAASHAGIKVLFTSEPTTRCYYLDGCLVLGRYSVRRWTSAETVEAITSGQVGPRIKQWFIWNSKKIPKVLGGEFYEKIRDYFWAGRK